MDEIKKNDSNWGGKREGAGRKKGGENKDTRERRLADQAYKKRVVAHIHDLFNSQLNLARGITFMYRIDEIKNEKGTIISKKHRIVESKEEIRRVLDDLDGDEHGISEDDYYYITTRAPDNRAIDSMMDRVFGKAPQTVEHSGSIDVNKLSEFKTLTSEQLLELAAAGVDEETEDGEGGTVEA